MKLEDKPGAVSVGSPCVTFPVDGLEAGAAEGAGAGVGVVVAFAEEVPDFGRSCNGQSVCTVQVSMPMRNYWLSVAFFVIRSTVCIEVRSTNFCKLLVKCHRN